MKLSHQKWRLVSKVWTLFWRRNLFLRTPVFLCILLGIVSLGGGSALLLTQMEVNDHLDQTRQRFLTDIRSLHQEQEKQKFLTEKLLQHPQFSDLALEKEQWAALNEKAIQNFLKETAIKVKLGNPNIKICQTLADQGNICRWDVVFQALALLDSDIFLFIQELQKVPVGILIIQEYQIKRESALSTEMLRGIAAGESHYLFGVTLKFLWITKRQDDR